MEVTKQPTEIAASGGGRRRKIGRWYLAETLGKGGYSWVKKGYDRKTGRAVALKFMDRKRSKANDWNEKQLRQVKTEIEALKQMKHPNIMRLLAYNLHTKYPDTDNTTRDVILLVLEYMPGGELFDVLYYTSKLEEIVARTYFRQLIEGLESCHNACIVHRDIKPQNLLLDKNFNLKITDFGLAKLIESDNDAVMDTWHVGTRGYQAPEILMRTAYTSSCDIFSAGVVLFILLSGYPPFEHAKRSDRWYGHIANKEYKQFWKSHKGCGIAPPAMDLITRMLHFDREKRISIPHIKQHPWYKGDILTTKQLTQVLRLRHQKMELKRAKDPVKQDILNDSERKMRSDGFLQQLREKNLNLKQEAPPLPEGESVGILDVFTEKCGYEVLDYILGVVKETTKGTVDVNFENFSMVVNLAVKTADVSTSVNPKVSMLIRVYHYAEYQCNIVKFHRLEGSPNAFRTSLKHITRTCRNVLTGLPAGVTTTMEQSLSAQEKEVAAILSSAAGNASAAGTTN